jgi:hypothetical protein
LGLLLSGLVLLTALLLVGLLILSVALLAHRELLGVVGTPALVALAAAPGVGWSHGDIPGKRFKNPSSAWR